MSRRTRPKLTWGCHSTTDNPVGFLLWRLVHRCISIFSPQRQTKHTHTFGYYSRRRSSVMVGVDPVGAIAGTSPRTPASPARSPARVLRTSRPCRPCHCMCCAAGEGVCTYVPNEERGPRGTGLGGYRAPRGMRLCSASYTRGLQNLIEWAVILSPGPVLQVSPTDLLPPASSGWHLPQPLRSRGPVPKNRHSTRYWVWARWHISKGIIAQDMCASAAGSPPWNRKC